MKDEKQTAPAQAGRARGAKKDDQFPTRVFRSPGKYDAGSAAPGETYSSRGARTPDELERLLEQGWSKTIAAAVAAAEKKAGGK